MKVFFNASVILAGARSPGGASGELLKRVKHREIAGVISELIVEEAIRHADRAGVGKVKMEKIAVETFSLVASAPEVGRVKNYQDKVLDPDDAHVLASAVSEKCEILVSLDKKHLLVLGGKIKGLKILLPGQLLLRLK